MKKNLKTVFLILTVLLSLNQLQAQTTEQDSTIVVSVDSVATVEFEVSQLVEGKFTNDKKVEMVLSKFDGESFTITYPEYNQSMLYKKVAKNHFTYTRGNMNFDMNFVSNDEFTTSRKGRGFVKWTRVTE